MSLHSTPLARYITVQSPKHVTLRMISDGAWLYAARLSDACCVGSLGPLQGTTPAARTHWTIIEVLCNIRLLQGPKGTIGGGSAARAQIAVWETIGQHGSAIPQGRAGRQSGRSAAGVEQPGRHPLQRARGKCTVGCAL